MRVLNNAGQQSERLILTEEISLWLGDLASEPLLRGHEKTIETLRMMCVKASFPLMQAEFFAKENKDRKG